MILTCNENMRLRKKYKYHQGNFCKYYFIITKISSKIQHANPFFSMKYIIENVLNEIRG